MDKRKYLARKRHIKHAKMIAWFIIKYILVFAAIAAFVFFVGSAEWWATLIIGG